CSFVCIRITQLPVSPHSPYTTLFRSQRPEVFSVARVGLGALGVISTLTLQCVPAFDLHAFERPERVDELLADIDTHVEGNDHFEDRKSTRLNSSHVKISYAVFCLKKT